MTTMAFDVFWRDHGAAKGAKDFAGNADKAHESTSRLSKTGAALGTAFGAFIGLDVFGSFISQARESLAIGRITEARIQSTGGAAHVTTQQVNDLATAISNKTGADDEAVQSGSNMLLTFTGIRNEVGKGNDIFNQASQAATDMAAAFNKGEVTSQGTTQQAVILGKALNDPIQGLTALRRVGVAFTQQQQDQIKTLVKSGDTLGAQKIILAELSREFGGTARAAADPLQRLSVITGNLAEQVGTAMMPAFDKFATFMANTGAPAISSFVTAVSNIPAPVYAAAAGLTGLVLGVHVVSKAVDAVKDVTGAAGDVLRLLGLRAAEGAVAAEGAATKVAGAAEGAATKVSGLRSGIGGLAGGLAGPLGLALTGAVIGVGLWAKAQADARQRVADLTGAISDDSGALAEHTRKLIVDRLESDGVLKAAQKLGISLADVTDAAMGNAAAQGRVNAVLDQQLSTYDAARRGTQRAVPVVGDYQRAALNVRDAVSAMNDDVNSATNSFRRQQAALHPVTAAVSGYDAQARAVVKTVTTRYLTPGLGAARANVQGLAGDIRGIHGTRVVVQLDASGNVVSQVFHGNLKQFASGGVVSGPGGPRDDRVLARLSAGEFIVNAAATARHRGLLEALNGRGYAAGGLVTVQGHGRMPPPGIDAWYLRMMNAIGRAAGAGLTGPIPGGSGVTRWAPLVRQVLAMEGLAAGLIGRVLSQMSTESGGNPRAINLWDINAKNGDPSKGLMQVIGGTFAAYHWPGTSWDIYNPTANIAAALNYARHRYGPGLSALGHGHGYDQGGVATGTGLIPKFTNAPERVLSPSQTKLFDQALTTMSNGGGGTTVVNVNLVLDPSAAAFEDKLIATMDRVVRQGRLTSIMRRAVA